MLVVFFLGIGASSILASNADTPLQMSICLTLIGMFAAIYHPVGLAMVVHGLDKTGVPLAINGIFGNMGVASAALLTGFLVDSSGWRDAFIAPGVVSIVIGLLYFWFIRSGRTSVAATPARSTAAGQTPGMPRAALLRIFAIILFTTALGGLVFQSTTFSLPKVLDERLTDLASTATMVGWYAFLVFSVAAFAQLAVGYLVDNYSVRTVFASVAMLQAIFFFIMIGLTGVTALLVALAFMLVVFGQIPINDVLVGRIARSEWRSRAYALRYIVTFSVSASAIPMIAWIHGSWGFDTLFGVLAIAALVIFVATLCLPKANKSIAAPVAATE
jgi:MFS family permease